MLQKMAEMIAKEEREAEMQKDFKDFMSLPEKERTYKHFKQKLMLKIEKPSKHSVQGMYFHLICFVSFRFVLLCFSLLCIHI